MNMYATCINKNKEICTEGGYWEFGFLYKKKISVLYFRSLSPQQAAYYVASPTKLSRVQQGATRYVWIYEIF